MAFDTFLKLADIKGESTDSKHADEIEIFSFSWGASNPVTIGSTAKGSGAGKVSISSFNFMKKTEKSSPDLFEHACNGKHIATADVVMRKAGGSQETFLEYKFEEVFVESIQWSGSSGGDDSPTESVSMAFGKVTVQYTPQNADGTMGDMIPKAYDIRQNLGS